MRWAPKIATTRAAKRDDGKLRQVHAILKMKYKINTEYNNSIRYELLAIVDYAVNGHRRP